MGLCTVVTCKVYGSSLKLFSSAPQAPQQALCPTIERTCLVNREHATCETHALREHVQYRSVVAM